MTREAARSVQGRNLRADNVDPLASLWEHVTFAKLPWDAPSELTELVVNVENPKRVYAVHRASRRHNFQLLVEKFVVQLRYGCDSPNCTTSTCFTFRKRIVGKAPIRRYNTTSARTLAVYLASQDNPEAALCPYVHVPKAPPVALSSLVLTPKHPRKRPSLSRASNKDSREESHCKEGDNGNEKAPSEGGAQCDTPSRPTSPAFAINDRPPSKDYRSFAANVFGSVAFKMLEWLTPNSIDKLTEMADGFDNAPAGKQETTRASSPTGKQRSPSPAKRNNPHPPDVVENKRTSQDTPRTVAAEVEKQPVTTQPASRKGSNPAGSQRRNSNARVRKSSTSNPKRQLSIEAFTDSQSPDDKLSGLRSPRLPGLPQEKATKPFMSAALPIARSMSQSSDDFIKRCSSPDVLPSTEEVTVEQKDLSCSSPKPSETSTTQSTAENTESVTSPLEQEPEGELLPQSLSKLSVEIVDLLCDILQEDGTGESRMLEPPTVPRKTRRTIKRKRISGLLYPAAMKVEWKLFIEQSLFHVLSDPRAIVSSFTTDAGLLDSYALWYCMLRLTRVAPTLVFDSLWMAVASLFAPPKRLHSLRSPTTRFFRIPERTLNSEEASHLMTICLHALVAAAPVLTNPAHLLDISRLRSHGLSIDNSAGSSRIPPEICLQYDDVFSDELLLRLARRVFAAITTRRTFNELVEADLEFDEAAPESDILEALLSQLDSLTDEPASSIAFSPDERDMHRKRVPTLLLDWARAIMLGEWDGSPEVPGTGPFGGALALIAALHKKRRELHLGDGSFRSDYFSERLDSVEMPIAWLSHQSSRNRHHLLDYPYMFSPATLVSYFRAINFSRMSRSFEESSSLQNRMRHIMQDGSLISNDAHKQLLQDLLKTASSQYLILEIRRMDPLKDAFDQLWRRQERELLRPLKVHLGEESGEEGFDSGGVQQEFFRLAIAEALDPKYGLFTIDERTRMAWFRPGSPAEEWKFELVGLLISLAVYNGLTLPVTFPMALYRKLLGEPVQELHHIEDGWPDLTNGLTNLLEWDEANGKVEDVFARTYEFSIEYFGEHVSREMTSTSSSTTPSPSSSTASSHILPSALKNASASSQQQHQQQASPSSWPQFSNFAVVPAHKENPEDAPLVTNSNRNAYVSDYIRYLTQVSVAPQYAAFERGFRTVLHPKSLTLLTSPLLQSIVEGTQEIDISELKRAARYVGWDSRHRTIKDFWSIVKRYDDTMKRKLLEFVTASDRVPVGGMRNVTFVIQKNGEEGLGEEEEEEEEANQRVVVLEGESYGEGQADSNERRENRADGAEDPQAQPAVPQTTRKKAWHLPTAYTCYGTLLLPEYKDKETLRERLAMALENASGFGFA